MNIQKSKALWLLLPLVALSGCIEIKPLRQPPPDPVYISNIRPDQTVMVIPFNNYINQVGVARNLEMVLVNLGFSVKSYEVDVKEIEKRTGAGVAGAKVQEGAGSSEALGAEAKEVTIERYRSYEKINADYAFEVLLNDYDGVIKVVKTKDKAVVAVCQFRESSLEDDAKECLEKRNIIVKKTP